MVKKNDKLPQPPQGSANLGVTEDGQVFIQFPEKVSVMVFTPEQAEQIGVGFIQHAAVGAARKAQKWSPSSPIKSNVATQPGRKM